MIHISAIAIATPAMGVHEPASSGIAATAATTSRASAVGSWARAPDRLLIDRELDPYWPQPSEIKGRSLANLQEMLRIDVARNLPFLMVGIPSHDSKPYKAWFLYRSLEGYGRLSTCGGDRRAVTISA